MPTRLRVEDLWPRLRGLCAKRGPRYVAVPFVGQGSFSRIRLRRGDVLVARCDPATVRAGLTDPRELVKYVKAGVEVHSATALHAKVFVLGRTAVIGSSNISASSEGSLIEAGLETTQPQVVANCIRFVKDLRGDLVGLADASQLVSQYRPPQGGARQARRPRSRHRQDPGQTPMWILGLEPCAYDEDDVRHAQDSREAAKKRMTRPRVNRLEDFLWEDNLPFRVRDRIVMCTTESAARTLVDAPARIVAIQRYRVGGRPRAIVWVEKRPGTRRREAKSLVKRIGPTAKLLLQASGAKRLGSTALTYALGQVWPHAGFNGSR